MELRSGWIRRLIACLCAALMLLALPLPVMAYAYDEGGMVCIDGKIYEFNDSYQTPGASGWSYDAASKTLTLDGFHGSNIAWLECSNLTVVLKGDNTIGGSNSAGIYVSFGITARNGTRGLIIKGDGTLTVNGGITIEMDKGTFIMESGKLVCNPIKDTSGLATAIEAGNVNINGGSIEMNFAPNVAEIDGYYGFKSNTFNMSGGSVTATGEESRGVDHLVQCIGNASVTGGVLSSKYPIAAGNFDLGSKMTAVSGQVTKGVSGGVVGDTILLQEGGTQAPVVTPQVPEYTSKTGEKVDAWAQEGVNKAIDAGLMPECLKNTDLTKNITRAQFAALVITLYEKMGGQPVSLDGVTNPFTDTQDSMVLKAYALGIANGTGTNIFSPDKSLTREEAATMLLRAYEKLGDNVKEYNFEPFADDAMIVDWAKKAVYFMADKGIVNGVGNNNFNPKGSAQSQQTLIIALRMLNNLSV